jgi:hypothetical protein
MTHPTHPDRPTRSDRFVHLLGGVVDRLIAVVGMVGAQLARNRVHVVVGLAAGAVIGAAVNPLAWFPEEPAEMQVRIRLAGGGERLCDVTDQAAGRIVLDCPFEADQ